MRESRIQAEIRLALGGLPGVAVWRNNVGTFKTFDGRVVRTGLCVGSSDLVGLVDGRFVAFELKTAKGRLTTMQRLFLKLVRDQGGFACVLRSVDEAHAAIERCREGCNQ